MVENVFAKEVCGGREGDLERTDSGEEERIEGVALRADRGDDEDRDDKGEDEAGGDDEDGEAAADLVLAGVSIWAQVCYLTIRKYRVLNLG